MSTVILSAQQSEPFCIVEETDNPVYFSPLNSNYSGSIDPEWLDSFDYISFDIFFWGINKDNGDNNYGKITIEDIFENLKKINEVFKRTD